MLFYWKFCTRVLCRRGVYQSRARGRGVAGLIWRCLRVAGSAPGRHYSGKVTMCTVCMLVHARSSCTLGCVNMYVHGHIGLYILCVWYTCTCTCITQFKFRAPIRSKIWSKHHLKDWLKHLFKPPYAVLLL